MGNIFEFMFVRKFKLENKLGFGDRSLFEIASNVMVEGMVKVIIPFSVH